MTPLGMPPMAGFAEAISGAMNQVAGAMNEVAQFSQAMQESLESATYNLTFLLPAATSANEQRCRLEVTALARVEEVLEMVQVELNAEDIATGLEFAGQELPLHAPIHALGIRDGDHLMVVRRVDMITL